MLQMIFFSLILGLFHGPENTLITIYDKDCGYCQVLLESTYQNDDVSAALSNYNHQLFEASEEESKKMIKEFGITSFPTQIRITKDKDTLMLEGYVNVEQQLRFLEGKTNTGKAVKELSDTADEMKGRGFGQSPILSAGAQSYICSAVGARRPFTQVLERIERVAKKESVKYDDIYKFFSDLSNNIICENTKYTAIREKASLFKFAADVGNYKFIEDIVDHDGDGKCNPNIDYAQKETLKDGTEEDLMGFLDKIIDDYNNGGGSNAVHDISALKRVKRGIEFCLKTL